MTDARILSIQMRRARWFDYVIQRFDLISFRTIADWLAQEPDGITRNEARRAQALSDLQQSVGDGEFGPARKQRCVVWLPKPPHGDMLGRFPLKLNYGQIVGMATRGHSVISGFSRSRLYRMAGAGDIVFLKCGKATLVEFDSLEAAVRQLPRVTSKAAVSRYGKTRAGLEVRA